MRDRMQLIHGVSLARGRASSICCWGRELFAPKADQQQSVGRQSKRPCKLLFFDAPYRYTVCGKGIFQIIILTRYYSCTFRPKKSNFVSFAGPSPSCTHAEHFIPIYLYIKKKFRLVGSTCPSCRLFSFSPHQFA